MVKKHKFNFADEEKEMACLKEIIGFFQDERNEEIGFVAAQKVLGCEPTAWLATGILGKPCAAGTVFR